MGSIRRTFAPSLAVAVLAAAGLSACGSGGNVDAETPTTRRSRFPAAVVSTTTPDVTTPFGGTVASTSTTKPAARATTTLVSAKTTTTDPAPVRNRPAATRMPSPRTAVGSAAWQGLVVVAGGRDSAGNASARVDAYNAGTGAWSRAPDLPQALSDVALGVQGDDLWAVGGFGTEGDQKIAQATTYHFHPGDTAWKSGPLLKTARAGVALATLNDALIVMGGQTTDGGTLDTVETLGVGDSDWKVGTPLTQKRAYASAVVGGGRVYAIGGRTDGVTSALDKVESWRPGDGWRAEESLKTKRARAGASGLCVAGGENTDGAVASVECLAARKWTTRFQMATPRHGLAVVTLDGWLHLIGGGPSSGPSVSAAHEIFDLGG